jgi:hypothetical protein
MKRILIAFERSGIVRRAFAAKGWKAISCDLMPSDDNSPYHQQCDVRELLPLAWDMIIAHPPCTYICGSGWHWVKRGRIESDGRPRMEHVNEAIAMARMFIDGKETKHIPLRVVENPIGILTHHVRKWNQIIQPHMFGDDASKATCLWLHGLPLLVPTNKILPRIVNGKKRWANQTDSGQNNLAPSPERSTERSRTYQGIADAMANQWSVFNH